MYFIQICVCLSLSIALSLSLNLPLYTPIYIYHNTSWIIVNFIVCVNSSSCTPSTFPFSTFSFGRLPGNSPFSDPRLPVNFVLSGFFFWFRISHHSRPSRCLYVHHIRKRCLYICKRALDIRKRALYVWLSDCPRPFHTLSFAAVSREHCYICKYVTTRYISPISGGLFCRISSLL